MPVKSTAAPRTPVMEPLLDALFSGASDLLLTAGSPPALRIDGDLVIMQGPALTPEDTSGMLRELVSDRQMSGFDQSHNADFSFQWQEKGRARGNAFRQRGSVAIALRAIPHRIPTFDDLGLPQAVRDLISLPHGLILITGPTGSGKSTTLASMVNAINRSRAAHIITIEDPIEYTHANHRSVVEQREVGVDTPSFPEALRSTLREDPDVVLVGEMRDLESIRVTLTIAETGHLVLATLHTNDAAQAISRMVDVFSGEQQQQIRVQLAGSLAAVIHQQLLPKTSGGRVAAFEVLLATPGVRNLIRENKPGQLRNVVATSARSGMQTLETSLSSLVQAGHVDLDTARNRSLLPHEVAAGSVPVTNGGAPRQ